VPLFLVRYHYIDDSEALARVRPTHREWLRSLGNTIPGSGPTKDNGAALVFEGESADAVIELVDQDPFWVAGFVAERTVVEWTLVNGRWMDSI
jgi:uncharacterized protein YciI